MFTTSSACICAKPRMHSAICLDLEKILGSHLRNNIQTAMHNTCGENVTNTKNYTAFSYLSGACLAIYNFAIWWEVGITSDPFSKYIRSWWLLLWHVSVFHLYQNVTQQNELCTRFSENLSHKMDKKFQTTTTNDFTRLSKYNDDNIFLIGWF